VKRAQDAIDWWPIAIFIMGAAVTFAAWWGLRTASRDQLLREVEAQAAAVHHEIGERLDDRVRSLTRMAARWERAGRPEPDLRRADVRDHLQHYPGYRAIGWVEPDRRLAWLVPAVGTETALGVDVSGNVAERDAMDRAERRRSMQATPLVPLPRGGEGVLLFFPIFAGNERLDGFLLAGIDPGSLLPEIVEREMAPDFAVSVSARGRGLFERGPTFLPSDASWSRAGTVRVGGLTWDTRVWLPETGRRARLARYPEGVALGGAWMTILLTLAVSAARRAARRKHALEVTQRQLLEALDDRLQAEAERRNADTLLRGERTLFAMMANRAPLADTLAACCRLVERVCPGTRGAILLRDPHADVLRPGAAPSLSPAFLAALDGLPIGPASGCCGTAAFRKAPVVVADIASDPLWTSFAGLAVAHGLRACWSYPMLAQHGGVAGTLAVYRLEPGTPTDADVALIERVRDLAAIAIDLSDVERALRLTQFAVDHVADQIFLIDPTGRFLDVNPAACRRLGYTREELLGMTVADIDPEVPESAWPASWAEVRRRSQWRFETSHRSKSGEVYPVELTANFVDHEGAQYSYAIVRDVSEWKRNLAALAASEERLRLATEAGRMGTWEWDARSKDFRHSPNLRLLFGLPSDDASVGPRTFSGMIHADHTSQARDAVHALFAGTAQGALETRIVWPDGSTHWIECSALVHRDAEGRPARLVGIVTDIDHRKHAEREREELLAEVRAANGRLTQLSRQLMEVQEAERRDLSRDLHDEIGQCIAAVKINLDLLCRRFPAIESEVPVADTRALLDYIQRHVSRLCLDLRPSLLDDLGLSAALRWYVHRQAERCEWQVHYDADELPKLPERAQDVCFRIAQEAITNVMRHARARAVTVELRHADETLRLRVMDDGVGFDPDAPVSRPWTGGGLGLLGMRERARSVGGEIVVARRAGGGTVVEAEIPVGDEDETPQAQTA
jgi:two-component system sensor histidine kinase UhpB